eukprot:jgi/Mesen1/2149/ME000152S01243
MLAMKRRPLIFVYELPPALNTQLLEGRPAKEQCALRTYDASNQTVFNSATNAHLLELATWEALLASPHRTLNPEEADYFYVPTLAACLLERANDAPATLVWEAMQGNKAWRAMALYQAALDHIRASLPYWDKWQGRDHVWAFGWDEGACLAPQSIRGSILLSHWGNTLRAHAESTTARADEKWTPISSNLRGESACYDASKDVVMPAVTVPAAEALERKGWAKPPVHREGLFIFRGDLGYNFEGGRREHEFSMGIRQGLAWAFASTPNHVGALGALAEEEVVVTNETSAAAGDLSGFKFCGVLPGDGFSSFLEEAALHGCVPVIIQDGVEMPFENVLDYDAFSIRVAEKDIQNVVKILKEVGPERLVALQAALAGVWSRFHYLSLVRSEATRQASKFGHRETWAAAYGNVEGDDAISTLIEILHYKLHNDAWRKDSGSRKADYGVHPQCLVH